MSNPASTSLIDDILRKNQDVFEKLGALAQGPRGVWEDKKGKRWTLASYVAYCCFQEEFSLLTNDWLNAAIKLRTQSVPTDPGLLPRYRLDLIWLWTAATLGPSANVLSPEAHHALQTAMQDPATGPGKAGWGRRGTGWLGEAFSIIQQVHASDRKSVRSDPPELPLLLPMRALRGLLYANERTPLPFQFEPAQPQIQAISSGFLFPLRSTSRPEFAHFMVPADLKEHFSELAETSVLVALEVNSSALVGRPEEYNLFWNQLDPSTAERLIQSVFNHLNRALAEEGPEGVGNKKGWDATFEKWLAMGATGLTHSPHLMSSTEVAYVVDSVMSGEVKLNQTPGGLLDQALSFVKNVRRQETLDAALPSAFGDSLRSRGPRF